MATWGRNGRTTTDEMLDHENQRMTDQLSGKVNRLKNLALDIETDTKDSNTYLNGMGDDFDGSTGLLTGSMKRVDHMINSGRTNRKMCCYIVGLLVLFFLVFYYLISKLTAG